MAEIDRERSVDLHEVIARRAAEGYVTRQEYLRHRSDIGSEEGSDFTVLRKIGPGFSPILIERLWIRYDQPLGRGERIACGEQERELTEVELDSYLNEYKVTVAFSDPKPIIQE